MKISIINYYGDDKTKLKMDDLGLEDMGFELITTIVSMDSYIMEESFDINSPDFKRLGFDAFIKNIVYLFIEENFNVMILRREQDLKIYLTIPDSDSFSRRSYYESMDASC